MLKLDKNELIEKRNIFSIERVEKDFEYWFKVILTNNLAVFCKDIIFEGNNTKLIHLKQQVELFAR